MSAETIKASETVESLRDDIDVLRLAIYKCNLLNYVNDLGLDMLSPDVSRVFGNLDSVVISYGLTRKEEWVELPHWRRRGGDVGRENLLIMPGGFFRINEVVDGYYSYSLTDDIDRVLQRYAFIKDADFRKLEEAHWKRYDQIWEDSNPGVSVRLDDENEAYFMEAADYVDGHKLDLLKGLRSDMEARLAAISGASVAVDSK